MLLSISICVCPKVVLGRLSPSRYRLAADLVKACLSGRGPVTVKVNEGRRQDEEVAHCIPRAMEAAGRLLLYSWPLFNSGMYRVRRKETVNRVCDATLAGSGDMLAEAAAHALTGTWVWRGCRRCSSEPAWYQRIFLRTSSFS